MPWLTPETLPSVLLCRRLSIPSDLRLIAAVSGALSELTKAENWEQFGSQTPEDTAYAMMVMLNGYFESGVCMIGAVMAYATLQPPENCLSCDGSSHNREDYPQLYAVLQPDLIDDADTFHTPDIPSILDQNGVSLTYYLVAR